MYKKRVIKMILVGFSYKTHIPIVRLLCRNFKHCAIITSHKNKFILHQFVGRNNVAYISINRCGIKQLEKYGWRFIRIDVPFLIFNPNKSTCVNYVKYAIGLNKLWIQTPDALFRYIKKI